MAQARLSTCRVVACLVGVSFLPYLLWVWALLAFSAGPFDAELEGSARPPDEELEREAVTPTAPPQPRIDPGTPLAVLLPRPPAVNRAPVYLGDDLAELPERMLEATPREQLTTEQWQSRKALASAAALHLNGTEEDGFLKALLRTRPDLAGLPFAMGDACRTRGEQAQAFKEAADAVRSRKEAALVSDAPEPDAAREKKARFWLARTAVATQVLPGEKAEGQPQLVRALAAVPRPEATRELARLAAYSPEEATRNVAIEALSVRRGRDYTAVLVQALRYPWPAVAENAARAIVNLDRKDLIPQLKAVLAEPDPRGPRTEVVAGRKETVAHEVVRVNHLRNCLLCHAPAERGKVPDETLVAEVPIPTEPLPDGSEGYGRSGSNLLVRIDTTYLRQDFSAMQVAERMKPWPVVQRFDFLVRKRVLSPAEAADLAARLQRRAREEGSPYHRAAEQAIRDLRRGGGKGKAAPGGRLVVGQSIGLEPGPRDRTSPRPSSCAFPRGIGADRRMALDRGAKPPAANLRGFSLAQAAYDERSLPSGHLGPNRLAILADALEEAGCTDQTILDHLRGPGPTSEAASRWTPYSVASRNEKRTPEHPCPLCPPCATGSLLLAWASNRDRRGLFASCPSAGASMMPVLVPASLRSEGGLRHESEARPVRSAGGAGPGRHDRGIIGRLVLRPHVRLPCSLRSGRRPGGGPDQGGRRGEL
jgi:hypothetical protein